VVDACGEQSSKIETDGPVSCEVWTDCESGHELRLCLHDGKHRVPAVHLERTLSWAESVGADD
jgi:hypothetical protein